MLGTRPKGNDGILHCTDFLRTILWFGVSQHAGLEKGGRRFSCWASVRRATMASFIARAAIPHFVLLTA
jgi:hypothetical protein